MVKLDATSLRYLSKDDFRVLVAVEMGMKNHDLVPTSLIGGIAKLKRGGTQRALSNLHKYKLIFHEAKRYDGYRLTYGGYDYLALRTLTARGCVVALGNQIGVGKESDIYCAEREIDEDEQRERGMGKFAANYGNGQNDNDDDDDDQEYDGLDDIQRERNRRRAEGDVNAVVVSTRDTSYGGNRSRRSVATRAAASSSSKSTRSGRSMRYSVRSGMSSAFEPVVVLPRESCVIKFHRLGRTSFRAIKQKRDYLIHRKSASWLYMSRLAALKEFAYMKVLYDNGFPVPRPIDVNRHCVVMELLKSFPLSQIKRMANPDKVYGRCMRIIVQLARAGLIHCDFNEFNLMVDDSECVIVIDFPQMVSTSHMNARMYFDRDVECIRVFFKRRFNFDGAAWPTFDKVMRDHQAERDAAEQSGEQQPSAENAATQASLQLDVLVEASGFSRADQDRFESLVDRLNEDKESSSDDGEAEEGDEKQSFNDDGEKQPFSDGGEEQAFCEDSSSQSDNDDDEEEEEKEEEEEEDDQVQTITFDVQEGDEMLSLEERIRKQLGIADLKTRVDDDGDHVADVESLQQESKDEEAKSQDEESESKDDDDEKKVDAVRSTRVTTRSQRRRNRAARDRANPNFIREKVKRDMAKKGRRRRWKQNENKNRGRRELAEQIKSY
jgi:RIO kinase 2